MTKTRYNDPWDESPEHIRFCSSSCYEQYYYVEDASACDACDRTIFDSVSEVSHFFDYGKERFCEKCCVEFLRTKGQAGEDFEDDEVRIYPLIKTMNNFSYMHHAMGYDDLLGIGFVIR